MLVINKKIIIEKERDIVLIHLYIQGLSKKVYISEGIRELLYEIYKCGGISDKEEFDIFVKNCIGETSIKTLKSIRNTLSKCVKLGLIINRGKYSKVVSPEWILAKEEKESIGLHYKIITSDVFKKITAN